MNDHLNPAQQSSVGPVSGGEFAQLMALCGEPSVGEGFVVAVSGGADSMALALLAQRWGQDRGIPIQALTVDHGLRAGSAAEAVKVTAWLAARSCDHHILTWKHDRPVTSAVQARARQARYRLMGDWCQAHGVTRLLAAHHLGDQAETVLMRLKKGSTLFGLAAMAAVTKLYDCPTVTLCRPLLPVPKARLIATLQAQGQAWVEDPSNQNSTFERVRVRAQLVHLAREGVTAARLAGAARGARVVRDILDEAAERLMDTCVIAAGPGVVLAKAFDAAPEVVRGRALANVLIRLGGGAYAPSPAKLDRLLRWMAQEKNQEPHQETGRSGGRTLAGCWVHLAGEGFLISPEPSRNRARRGKKGD